jgi:hypothetical protein
MTLKGKRIMVLGGSSGIGAQVLAVDGGGALV